MATPTAPEERFYTVAAKRAATWRTAVAVGALGGIRVESDGSPKPDQDYKPYENADMPFPTGGNLADNKAVDFSPSGVMRYDPGQLGVFLAELMGTAGTPATATTGVYKHTIQWADIADGLFSTFISEYPAKIREVRSCKPIGIAFTIADGHLKWTLKLRGDNLVDDSAVNGATQVDAVTYVDIGHRVRFADLAVKMNASAGALSSETALLHITGISIDFERKLDALHTAGNGTIDEPKDDGSWPVITVKLQFARSSATDQALQAAFKAGTAYKLSAVFTGDNISTTYYYFLGFLFPRLVMTKTPEWKKAKLVSADVEFTAEEASANPTGMSYKRPYIEIQNVTATDYLT